MFFDGKSSIALC